MYITMDKKTHTYSVDGDIASISITELLTKHGLAPDYSGVSKEKKKEAAERGKAVHKDIECFINNKGYEPETPQGLEFAKWALKNLETAEAEVSIAYEFKGMLIAGTIDLIGTLKSGERIVDDHKNTASFNAEYVAWQVSIGDYFLRKANGRIVNDRKIEWAGAEKFFCTHFDPKSGKLSIKELDKIPDSEIERLIFAEYNGEKYVRPKLVVENELRVSLERAEQVLFEIEQAHKKAKETAEKCRAALLAEMERQGIYSFEGEKVKAGYRSGYDSVRVDATKLRRELPEVYAQYTKTVRVKPTVTISIKGGENNAEEESF